MAELPRGSVLETRRGGPDVLRTLVRDFFSDSQEGYIRIERKPKDDLPRIGQIILSNGEPLSAIHEQSAVLFSLPALLEIEEDAVFIDALLTVVVDVDVAHIDSLFPDARLHIDTVWSSELPESVGQRWWLNREVRSTTWAKANENSLPEIETVVEAPEFIQRAAEVRRAQMQGELCGELTPGQVLLLDATDNHNSFKLASELALLGRPVLVLSRVHKERLVVEYGLPSESCWWLTERATGEEQSCGAGLEDITRTITDFLWGNLRAIVILDGLEFLASVHGVERTFGFLRRLVDTFHDSDDALMIPVDLLAWEEKDRRLLIRETESASNAQVEFWLADTSNLAMHPLCAPPTDEEVAWIEAALKNADSLRKKATSAGTQDMARGLANRFSAGDFAQEWLQDEDVDVEVPQTDAPADDWVPTFHSAKRDDSLTQSILSSISDEEEESEDEVVMDENQDEVPKLRIPHRLGKRREIRTSSKTTTLSHQTRRDELSAAATRANEVDVAILDRKSSLLDNRLAKAKQALHAIEVASSMSAEIINSKQLPISNADIARERKLGEWEQAVSAASSLPANKIPSDPFEHQSWVAAMHNAATPHSSDLSLPVELGPMTSRPGVEISTETKGRDSATREQKDMSISAISRRVAIADEVRNTTGKVLTNLTDLEDS